MNCVAGPCAHSMFYRCHLEIPSNFLRESTLATSPENISEPHVKPLQSSGHSLSILPFLAALGLPCCVRAFGSCGARGLLFLRGAASSLRWPLPLQRTGSKHAGSVAVAHGLRRPCSLPRQGTEPMFPALAQWIFNHWTTREVWAFF